MNGKWLKGSSSNYRDDADTDPDYIFEASQNSNLMPPSADRLTITSAPQDIWSVGTVTTFWRKNHRLTSLV